MERSQTPRRPVGRPPGAGVVDPDDLLDRALTALAGGGYRALSMRGLARSLGVSLASVQHRHATKEDLWRAAVDHITENADVGGEAIESFPVVLRQRIDEASAYPGLLSSLLSDDAPGHEHRIEYLAERLRPTFDAARHSFAAAAGDGMTRDVDTEVLIAMMLVGVGAIGALPDQLRSVLELGDDPGRRLAEGLADLILFGVVARA